MQNTPGALLINDCTTVFIVPPDYKTFFRVFFSALSKFSGIQVVNIHFGLASANTRDLSLSLEKYFCQFWTAFFSNKMMASILFQK
jgi:hypothetical protein